MSVCTSMCHIVPQPKTYLQYSDSLAQKIGEAVHQLTNY